MKPHRSILNRDFRYVPSGQTDLRRTFARIRREQAAARPEAVAEAVATNVVTTLRKKL